MVFLEITAAIFLVLLGAGITEFLRRKQRIESLGREIYLAKIQGSKEIMLAFGRLSMEINPETRSSVLDAIAANSLIFPTDVVNAFSAVLQSIDTKPRIEILANMGKALFLIRDDLGLPALEEDYFKVVLKGIDTTTHKT